MADLNSGIPGTVGYAPLSYFFTNASWINLGTGNGDCPNANP